MSPTAANADELALIAAVERTCEKGLAKAVVHRADTAGARRLDVQGVTKGVIHLGAPAVDVLSVPRVR